MRLPEVTCLHYMVLALKQSKEQVLVVLTLKTITALLLLNLTIQPFPMASLVESGHISDVDNTLEELTFHLHSETDQVHV